MVVLFTLILLFISNQALSHTVCDNITLSKIMPYMPPDYRIISKKPVKGVNLCDILIEVNGKIIPIYANSKIAIVGSLFKNGKSLSDKEVNDYLSCRFKKRFQKYGKSLDSIVACSYYPKGSKKSNFFYLIVDPNSPYANSIKNEIEQIANRLKMGVKLILVNKYKGSESKILSFICNRKGFKDYLSGNYGKPNSCRKGRDYVKRSSELIFGKFNISYTPTFITQSGKKESGINTRLIKHFLKKNGK